MSNPVKTSANNRHGQQSRPLWDRPEECCGDFMTDLPGGKSVWMAIGRAADLWRNHLAQDIRRLLQTDKFQGVGVSFFIYMVGKDKSTSSPKIIFCSSDVRARRAVRDAVRASGILEPYPAIGLGDSSSPLTRADSGLYQHTPQLPTPARSRSHQAEQTRVGVAPERRETEAEPISHGSGEDFRAATDDSPTVTQQFNRLYINRRPSLLSLDDSTISGPAPSASSCSIMCNCTPGTSVEELSLHYNSNTPIVKAVGSYTPDDDADDSESYSEDDEDSTPPNPDGLHFSTPEQLNHIINMLLNAFASYRPRTVLNGNQEAPNSQFSEVSGLVGSSSSQHGTGNGGSQTPRGRRRRLEDDDDDSDAIGPEAKKAKTDKVLACPFWKKDPQMYSCCYKSTLKEVKRVKQHLKRSHRKSIRCARCQEVFRDRNTCDQHVRNVRCDLVPEEIDEGITEGQVEQLNRRGPASQTQSQRWYAVWRIVFPGLAEPKSPYRDDDLPQVMVEFRDFSKHEGRRTILDHMQTSPDWDPIIDEWRFCQPDWPAIIDRAVDDIFLRFLSRRGGSGISDAATGAATGADGGNPSASVALDPLQSLPEARDNFSGFSMFEFLDSQSMPGVDGGSHILPSHPTYNDSTPWNPDDPHSY